MYISNRWLIDGNNICSYLQGYFAVLLLFSRLMLHLQIGVYSYHLACTGTRGNLTELGIWGRCKWSYANIHQTVVQRDAYGRTVVVGKSPSPRLQSMGCFNAHVYAIDSEFPNTKTLYWSLLTNELYLSIIIRNWRSSCW